MLLLWRLKWYLLSSFLSSMKVIQNPTNFQGICSHPNMLLHWTFKLHLLVISLFQKQNQSALLSTEHIDCTIYSWLALSDSSSIFNSATTVPFLILCVNDVYVHALSTSFSIKASTQIHNESSILLWSRIFFCDVAIDTQI